MSKRLGFFLAAAVLQACTTIVQSQAPDGQQAAPDSSTNIPMLCHPCSGPTDCGGGGALCVADSSGAAYCGTPCSSGSDCPAGFECDPVTDAHNQTLGNNCLPANNGSCGGAMPHDAGFPMSDAGTPMSPIDAGFADGGGTPSDTGMMQQNLPFGSPCTDSAQCATGLCFNFNAHGMLCTEMCVNGVCPEASSSGCNGMGICKVP